MRLAGDVAPLCLSILRFEVAALATDPGNPRGDGKANSIFRDVPRGRNTDTAIGRIAGHVKLAGGRKKPLPMKQGSIGPTSAASNARSKTPRSRLSRGSRRRLIAGLAICSTSRLPYKIPILSRRDRSPDRPTQRRFWVWARRQLRLCCNSTMRAGFATEDRGQPGKRDDQPATA